VAYVPPSLLLVVQMSLWRGHMALLTEPTSLLTESTSLLTEFDLAGLRRNAKFAVRGHWHHEQHIPFDFCFSSVRT